MRKLILNGDFYPEQKGEGWTRTKEIQTFYRHRNREKAELDASLKREELQLRGAELDEKKVQQEGLMAQQENLTKMLCESIKSQQKQQEQLLQQMQLQNTALLTLLQGAVSKQKDTEEKYVTCGIYDC